MAVTVGFIGGGRVARIILAAWKHAGAEPARVVASDVDARAIESLRAPFPNVLLAAGDNLAPAAMDVVFLAVHPPALRNVLAEIRGRIPARSLLVSLAPKLTIAEITAALGGFSRVARVIPNAPSIVGAGFNPVSFGPALPAPDRQAFQALMAPLGVLPEVSEPDLESYAVLTAMGPTYLWFQLYELLEIAKGFGLEKPAATAALQAMVDGTLRTMLQSGLPPNEVLDLVPVKPLGEDEPSFTKAYRERLQAVFDRIRPAVMTA